MSVNERTAAEMGVRSEKEAHRLAERREELAKAITTAAFSPKLVIASEDLSRGGSLSVRTDMSWTPDLLRQGLCELVIKGDPTREQVLRFIERAAYLIEYRYPRYQNDRKRALAQGIPPLPEDVDADDPPF